MLERKLPGGVDFLLGGDPVIRWQTMRDLLDAPEREWQAERDRVAKEGWGAQFLAVQKPDGCWPTGRWTGTVWTLMMLVDLGLRPGNERFSRAFEHVVGRLMPKGEKVSRETLLTQMDLCHLGFWLRAGSYFCASDERLGPLADTILTSQMEDGGWNCRCRRVPKTKHSSFHTTFNVLEGLREAASARVVPRRTFKESEAHALEFMLRHKMYRSDRTGEVVNERFTDLTFPSHWHYTVVRGLDYIRQTPFIKDPRLEDPLNLIESRRKPNGRWPVEKRIPGISCFEMEKMGQDSRWNTLRILRVLRSAGRV